MPITGPASYLPTIAAFVAHWTDVNTALGSSPLIIRKATIGTTADVAIAGLNSLYDSLIVQHAAVQTAYVERDLASGDLTDVRVALSEKMTMFNAKVRQDLNTTKWQRSLPDLPNHDSGQGRYMGPVYQIITLWDKINTGEVLGTGVALLLRDGTTLDQFQTLAGLVEDAFRLHPKAIQNVTTEIEERNDIQDRIQPVLRQYRVAVEGTFAPTSALVESLPRLRPAGGHTPAAVTATGVWDATAEKAKITWTASTDPALAHYQVRYSPGTSYHDDIEDVIGTFLPADPRECLTLTGVADPGSTGHYKVYVVLDTGNEKGSDDVAVTHPE